MISSLKNITASQNTKLNGHLSIQGKSQNDLMTQRDANMAFDRV